MEERPTTPRRQRTVKIDYAEIEQIIQAAVNATVLSTRAHNQHLEELIEKHEHTLYGNGKEGLITKIDRIERGVNRWGSIGWRLVEVLVISGVVGVIILLVQNGLLTP